MLGDYEHADKADYHEDGQFEMVTGKNFFHNRGALSNYLSRDRNNSFFPHIQKGQ